MASSRGYDPSQVIFEIYQIGATVKVTAVDPASFTEVSMVGSPQVSEHELMRLARRKLEYVLAKKGKIDQPKR